MIINTVSGGGGSGSTDYLSVVDGKVCITYDPSALSSSRVNTKLESSNSNQKQNISEVSTSAK